MLNGKGEIMKLILQFVDEVHQQMRQMIKPVKPILLK